MNIQSAKELSVYIKSYEVAMELFHHTKQFPVEERYALTSQVRRSSRSVCMNLREAWAKRLYAAHFISKLTDSDGECNETDTALDFARDCGYLSPEDHARITARNSEVARMLGSMIRSPERFLLRQ